MIDCAPSLCSPFVYIVIWGLAFNAVLQAICTVSMPRAAFERSLTKHDIIAGKLIVAITLLLPWIGGILMAIYWLSTWSEDRAS